MTFRDYLAGAVFLVFMATAGHYLINLKFFPASCDSSPRADCLLDEAEAVLAEGEKSSMAVGLFVELAMARANRGETERARAIYKMGEENVGRFDHPSRQAMAWTMMGVAAVQAGDRETGRPYFARANEAAWSSEEQTARKVNETRSILSAQAGAGDLEGAMENVASLRTELWRAQTILGIAEGLGESGKPEQIPAILPRVLEALDAIDDEQVRLQLQPLLAGVQALAGDIEAAGATADGIDEIVPRAMAWRQITEAQAEAGDVDGALESFANIKHFSQRDWALWPIAVAQARAGDFDAAEDSLDRINDPMANGQAWGDVAAVYAASGDLKRAAKITETLQEGFERFRALRAIVQELAKAGEYDKAVGFVADIGAGDRESHLLHIVALEQARAGLVDDARGLLESIGRPDERDQVLSEIAAVEAKAGDVQQAVATARTIETPQWRATALYKVAMAMGDG